jgi:hypothetical protein
MQLFQTIFAFHLAAILLASPALAQPPEKPPVRVTISKQTTYITEPLRKDGYPDYLRYLNEKMSEGVTPQNNAAVLLWQAIGPSEIDKKHRNLFFKELGVDPPSESGSYFVDWETYHATLPQAKHARTSEANVDPDEVWKRHERAQKEPWTSQSDPELAAWLKANEEPIDLLVKASHRSRYYSPLVAGGEPFLAFNTPQINPVRQAAAALAARAMLRLGEGQARAAWDDVLAIYRIARHVGSGPMSLDALVSIATDGIAGRAAQRVVQLGNLNAEQLELMQADLAKLPPAPKWRDALAIGERFSLLDAVCTVAREGFTSFRDLSGVENEKGKKHQLLDLILYPLVDWDVSLRAGNEWFDRLVAALDAPTTEHRNKLWAEVDSDVSQLRERFLEAPSLEDMLFSPRAVASEKMSFVFAALMLPALISTAQAEDRGATYFTLIELAVSLERFRVDHGRYPNAIVELAPKYVNEIPRDAFADRPLKYKKSKVGYLLYSFGKNGQDDGGITHNDVNEADDIVVATPDVLTQPESEAR